MPCVPKYETFVYIKTVQKCKYCKGENLKPSINGYWCCECKKRSNYREVVKD